MLKGKWFLVPCPFTNWMKRHEKNSEGVQMVSQQTSVWLADGLLGQDFWWPVFVWKRETSHAPRRVGKKLGSADLAVLWVKCFHVNPPSFLPFHPFKTKIPFLPSLLTPFVKKKSPSVSAVINLHPWLSTQVSSSLWIPCVSALTLRNPSPKTYCPVGPQRCNFWSFLVVNFFWSEENMKITFWWVGCENVDVVLSVWYLHT